MEEISASLPAKGMYLYNSSPAVSCLTMKCGDSGFPVSVRLSAICRSAGQPFCRPRFPVERDARPRFTQ